MSQRIFYSLLDRVGGEGKYQNISLIIWSLIMFVCGSSSYFTVFLFYQDQYQCNTEEIDCNKFVCSLPINQRSQYINPKFTSLVSKFGDYRCEGGDELDKLQSFIFLGAIIGIFISTVIIRSITKKKLTILFVCLNLIGIILSIFGPSLFIASIGLFLNFAAKSVLYQMIICLVSQSVAQQIRGHHTIIAYLAQGVGVTLNGLVFKIIPFWQIALLIYAIIPLIIVLLGLIMYIQETPFDLVINYSPQQSLQALKRIAIRNGRQNQHKITIQQLQHIKQQYQQNKINKHNYTISILDLFRYKSLRLFTILSLIFQVFASFNSNGSLLSVKQLSMSIYVSSSIIGFSQIIANIVCYFIIDRFERKKVLYITYAFAFCISITIFIFFACNKGEQCSTSLQLIHNFGMFLYRSATTIGYHFFSILQLEFYPNQIRSLAFQVQGLAFFTTVVFIPQIIRIFQKQGLSVMIIYPITCVLIIMLCLNIPQTFGINPPQIIQQLAYEHHIKTQDKDKIN